MVKSIQSVLSKYMTIRGRAGRPEFWWWILVYATVMVVFVRLDIYFDRVLFANIPGMPPLPMASAVFMALLPAHVAVCARRLHDVGRSAWLLAVGVIPVIGALILLWHFLLPSVEAINRHGRPPEGVSYY